MDKEQDLSEITLLGNQNTKYKFEYDPTILEKFKKKFDDSIEDEQIVNLDCFEFQSRCLTGDTLIDIARDESKYPDGIPIKDLVGTEGYVFGVDPDTFEPVVSRYHDVRITQKQAPIVKVNLTWFSPHQNIWNDTCIRCTPDHLFLVRKYKHSLRQMVYTWKQAKDLLPNDHLVYSCRSQDTIMGTSVHRLVAEAIFGVNLSSQDVVHHIDGNHYNNCPNNLEITDQSEHSHYHRSVQYGYDALFDIDELVDEYNSGMSVADLCRKYSCDSTTIHARLDGLVEYRTQAQAIHNNYLKNNKDRDDIIVDLYNRGYTSYEIGDYLDCHETTILAALRRRGVEIRESNSFARWRREHPLPPLNHKVVSVVDDGVDDVYNMEVDKIHNFFANGCIVHNCPKTGQPDFATIHISYIPNKYMVESKSLKLYLFSFQQHGAFHETCVHTIMEDLVELLNPKFLVVYGDFNSRGGISILPLSIYADDNHKELKQKLQLEALVHNFSHRPRNGQ